MIVSKRIRMWKRFLKYIWKFLKISNFLDFLGIDFLIFLLAYVSATMNEEDKVYVQDKDLVTMMVLWTALVFYQSIYSCIDNTYEFEVWSYFIYSFMIHLCSLLYIYRHILGSIKSLQWHQLQVKSLVYHVRLIVY